MSFPSSPTEGQIFNTYIYKSGAWKVLGTIVDSGSNVYGHYIKYSDGLLMQYGTVLLSLAINSTSGYFGSTAGYIEYGSSTFNFPISFYDTNIYGSTGGMKDGGPTTSRMANMTTTNFVMCITDMNVNSATHGADWLAIGRWKA